MPSGYTHPIYEGKEFTFEQFACSCARAFGALVTLRDEPIDGNLPAALEPSPYYHDRILELQKELKELHALGGEEADRRAEEEYAKSQEYHREKIVSLQAMQERHKAMLDEAHKWTPPSPDHEGLKEFMIKQLTDSLAFDCSTSYHEKALATPKKSGSDWLWSKMEMASKSLALAKQSYKEELARTNERNIWIDQLRQSLKLNP